MEKCIDQLRTLRKEHGVRAITLIPDLAFLGLIDDILDATDTAQDLLKSTRPHRAYAMARVAVEATQRLLVIATATDYVSLGTRAWLYYRLKDASLGSKATAELGDAEHFLLDTWEKYTPTSRLIAHRQLSELQAQKRKADNFLGKSLAPEVTKAYEIIAKDKGTSVPPNATEANQAFYSRLCREAHACLRLEPASLAIDSDGFIAVVEQDRPADQISLAVQGALKTTLREAIEAIKYRLLTRRKENTAALLAATINRQAPPSLDYVDDMGCMLLKQGIGHAETSFLAVPCLHFHELPDTTVSATLRCGSGNEVRACTFDFKGHAREQLISLIERRFPGFSSHRIDGRLSIDLPSTLIINITAVLGSRQTTEEETFVPLIVTKVDEYRGKSTTA